LFSCYSKPTLTASPFLNMSSIQKVLLSYDEFLRLKEIEKNFESVNAELAELKKTLGTIL